MSRWREHSRAVILRTLASLPTNATDAERRKAVSAAYPYGERKMHPYKMWNKEVTAILGPKSKPKLPPGTSSKARYRIADANWRPPFFIWTDCRFCDQTSFRRSTRGCLSCGKHYDYLTSLFESDSFVALLATVRANPADDLPRGVIADWLEEMGDERAAELAGLFRATMTMEVAT